MTHSPPGRRAARARRARDAGPEQWLAVPRWRTPLDTLLVLAVTFAVGWLGLVVIPAAANSATTSTTDRPTTHDASPRTPGPTTDPSRWFAGPVYTGGPAAPTTEQAIATEAAAVVAAPRAPTTRVAPKRTTAHTAPRTTRAPAPKTTVAAAAAAVTPAAAPAATTTTTTTTTNPPATTTPPTTTTTETTSTSTSDPTTTSPATSTSSSSGP